jgi:hypothetical protein
MGGPEMEPPQGAEQPPLIVSRLLIAPCQAVFAAWTTAEHVQRWMCPEGATVAVAALDVRVGGAFRIDMLVNGVQTAHTGVYREIRPPHTPPARVHLGLGAHALSPHPGHRGPAPARGQDGVDNHPDALT